MYKNTKMGEFPGGLEVKDPALLSLLWLWFNPWPQELCMLQAWPKTTKTKKKKNTEMESRKEPVGFFKPHTSALFYLFTVNMYIALNILFLGVPVVAQWKRT